MNEWHYLCFYLGAFSGFTVPYLVHESYEWAVDEIIAWRLRRNMRRLYWFLPRRKP